MRKPTKDIHLTSYDDLLGLDATAPVNMGESKNEVVREIPLSQLYPFKDHPFHVRDDQKMDETVQSIRDYGVLVPGIVRKRPAGGYELIAGHRRKRGSELAGKDSMPVMVRDYTDDEATIIMIDSNIQREDILPSEKAFAYRMKMEALKHQGKGNGGQEIADLVGKKAGDSGRKVQRYIRLTELIPELLDMVDQGRIKVMTGGSLSYLSKEQQNWVLDYITEMEVSVSGAQADALKESSKEGTLTEAGVEQILSKKKKSAEARVVLSVKYLRKYFPENYSQEQMENIILNLLDGWKKRTQ